MLWATRDIRHTCCLGLQKSSLFRQVDFVKLFDEIALAKMQKPDNLSKSLNPLFTFQSSTGHSPEVLSHFTCTIGKAFSACQPRPRCSWTSLWGCVHIYICAVTFSGSLLYLIRKLGDGKEGYKGRRSDENIRLPQISPSDKAKLLVASYIPSASRITLPHHQTTPKSSWQLSSQGDNLGCEVA